MPFKGISFQPERDGVFSNRWLTAIQVDPQYDGLSNEKIRLALLNDNIETRPVWKPMHLQPLFTGCAYYGNHVAESIFKYGLCLPSGSNLKIQDLERVTTGIYNAIEKLEFEYKAS